MAAHDKDRAAMTDQPSPKVLTARSRGSPLTDPWEPIYQKLTPDAIILGLWLATPHTNARGFVHGGLIAALTDKAMGHSCGHQIARRGFAGDRQHGDRFHQQRASRAMAHGRDRRDQDRQHALLRAVFCESRRRRDRARQWDVPGGEEEDDAVMPRVPDAVRRSSCRSASRDRTKREFVTAPALQCTRVARCAASGERHRFPNFQSLTSTTRSTNVRTLADNSREVG